MPRISESGQVEMWYELLRFLYLSGVDAPDSNEYYPLTSEDHNEPSTLRRTPLLAHPSLSHSFGRLRWKQFVHPSTSSASIHNNYGLVIKLKRVARQHATAYGHSHG